MAATHKIEDEPLSASEIPTIRLLYSGTSGILAQPARVLTEDELWIGREVSLRDGLSLSTDATASAKHARIQLHVDPETGQQNIVLTDHQSTNGTFVNRARRARCIVRDGDIIQVGGSFLLIRNEPAKTIDGVAPKLIGKSPAMRRLRSELVRAGRTPYAVLLLGESGTGKELAAETIHELRTQSGRRGPLIPVNCAGVPETLAESSFFGHVAGAFSEARSASEGYFRAAEGGTLFLDEIGDLPKKLQPKLLRVLEDKRITPVGTTKAVPCDVQVVAATNHDLPTEVADGEFRQDLFARLDTQRIYLPPLRHRREDILLLLAHFCASRPPAIAARLVAELLHYRWPGNVRELRQFCRTMECQTEPGQAWDLTEGACAKLGLLPGEPPTRPDEHRLVAGESPGAEPASTLRVPLPRRKKGAPPPVSREELKQWLEKHQGNISHAARELDVDPHTLRRWLDDYGLRENQAA